MNKLIPYDDFGGSGPILHFAHSNGYTPGCFWQMLQPLTADYHVTGKRFRPLWPGSEPAELESWDVIAQDLRRFFAEQGYRQVIGVGHSLGAVTTMMAAGQEPDLFRALVLIEPVFLPPQILNAIAAQPDLAENMPLLPVTRRRRTHWPDRQSAFEHFRRKPVFGRWSDEALWDYINHGLHETDQGEVTLAFRREWEAEFYARPPLHVWARYSQGDPTDVGDTWCGIGHLVPAVLAALAGNSAGGDIHRNSGCRTHGAHGTTAAACRNNS